MSYLNNHLQRKIRQKLEEANEILNQYKLLDEKQRSLSDIERSIGQLCQTLENDTVSSVGSATASVKSSKLDKHREQATSVSFVNLPKSKMTTRSRAVSAVPMPSANFPELELDNQSSQNGEDLRDRARSVTKALQSLIDVAEKSGSEVSAESDYTKIMNEEIESPKKSRKSKRYRVTRSNLQLTISTIKSWLDGFFRMLKNNPLMKRYLDSLLFDGTMFVLMFLLIVHFVPCNKIPGFTFTNPYAQY